MFNQSKNPRVKRSLVKITMATYELLRNADLRDLTVTAIATKAGVTRKTFYRNFGDVIDVLDYGFYSFILPFYQNPHCDTYYDFVLSTLAFASEHKDVLLMAKKQSQFSLLERLGIKYLPNTHYIQSVVAHHQSEGFEGTFCLIVASLTCGLLEEWVDNDFRQSPTEVASKGVEAIAALAEGQDL
jgi:AcrR family transcriptional regulator